MDKKNNSEKSIVKLRPQAIMAKFRERGERKEAYSHAKRDIDSWDILLVSQEEKVPKLIFGMTLENV